MQNLNGAAVWTYTMHIYSHGVVMTKSMETYLLIREFSF